MSLIKSIPTTNEVPSRSSGKERDPETGLDYFGARHYGSAMARFMTPDSPAFSTSRNPQSWNLYAYSLNNPISRIDLDGHMSLAADGWSRVHPRDNGAIFGSQPTSRVTTVALPDPPEAPPAPEPQAQKQENDNRNGGLVYKPTPEYIDIQGLVKSLLGLFGIEFASSPSVDTNVPQEFPLPANLIWIDRIVNGHGWEEHGKFEFDSKEEYTQMVIDTVQNAKGKSVVRNPEGRKDVTGFWNDKEGFVVWRDKNHPDQGTAFHPDQPDIYKKKWGFE